MSPSRQAKAAGLRNLKQAADITGQHPNTLTLWHRTKPELFKVVLAGCVALIAQAASTELPPESEASGETMSIEEYFFNNKWRGK